MIFYQKYSFAFQHINRTGGISVKTVLNEVAGEPDKGSNMSTAHQYMVNRLNVIRSRYPYLRIYDIPIYVNVRNPFHRIVSIYSFRRMKGRKQASGEFKDFFYNVYMKAKTPASGPMEKFLIGHDGKMPPNLVPVRFGQMNEKWPKIIEKHFKAKVDPWPVKNSSNHEDPMSYYNKRMIREVLEKEKFVIKNFFPRLKGLK